MKSWWLPILLMFGVMAEWAWREDLHHLLLAPDSFPSTAEIQKKNSEWLFRFGPTPRPQKMILQALFKERSIRQQRQHNGVFQAATLEAVADEMHFWRRQWENDDERQRRLAGQGLTETQMEQSIDEALLDQIWIEQEIASEISVTDDELKEAYEAQKDALKLPQSYHVAHLFLSHQGADEKKRLSEIQQLHQRLIQGESWTGLVQAHSNDSRTKKNGGDLGWVTTERMPQELITTMRHLKVGEISPPVHTSLGWHLIQVKERQPARQPRLEEVQSELIASLIQQKRKTALERLLHRHPGATL